MATKVNKNRKVYSRKNGGESFKKQVEYRLLGKKEVIQEGDETLSRIFNGEWISAKCAIGLTLEQAVSRNYVYPICRRLISDEIIKIGSRVEIVDVESAYRGERGVVVSTWPTEENIFVKVKLYVQSGHNWFEEKMLKVLPLSEDEKLNALAAEVHAGNKNWWIDLKTGEPIERNRGELLMLVISELAEAMEGARKELMDDHLKHRKMEEVEMADAYIRLLDLAGGFKIELSTCDDWAWDWLTPKANKGEALIKICAIVMLAYTHPHQFKFTRDLSVSIALKAIRLYCKNYGWDLDSTMAEKRAYNAKRADHKIENRKKQGGKKF